MRPGFGAGVDGFGRLVLLPACVFIHRIVPPVRGRGVIGRSALELGRILCGVDFASPPVREAGSRDRDLCGHVAELRLKVCIRRTDCFVNNNLWAHLAVGLKPLFSSLRVEVRTQKDGSLNCYSYC